MAKRRYFGGDSEAQAVIAAAGQFGIDPTDLAFEVVDKKHGFTKRRRRVLIAVDPEAPARVASAPAAPEAPVAMAEDVAPEAAAAASEEGSGESETSVAAEAGEHEEVESSEPVDDGPDEDLEAVAEAEPSDDGHEDAPAIEAVQPEPDMEDEADADDAEAEEAPPPPPLDGEAVERIVGLVDTMLDLADLDVEPAVSIDEGNVLVDVDGPEREFLLEDGGELLDALDYLGYRMCRQAGYQPESFRVDSKGFRSEREEQLRDRAAEAAAEAIRTGEMVAFEPLDPASRRIVHMALRETEGVETVSHGKGFLKRVKIFPQD